MAEFPPTRASLLVRLREPHDGAACSDAFAAPAPQQPSTGRAAPR